MKEWKTNEEIFLNNFEYMHNRNWIVLQFYATNYMEYLLVFGIYELF